MPPIEEAPNGETGLAKRRGGRAAPKRELERDGTAPATWEMPPRRDASASGGEGAQNLSLLQYAFTVILTSHRVDGSIESTRRRGAFDSIAPLRRVDCLYADSILLQIESIDCSYRLDRLDLEFIQRV